MGVGNLATGPKVQHRGLSQCFSSFLEGHLGGLSSLGLFAHSSPMCLVLPAGPRVGLFYRTMAPSEQKTCLIIVSVSFS